MTMVQGKDFFKKLSNLNSSLSPILHYYSVWLLLFQTSFEESQAGFKRDLDAWSDKLHVGLKMVFLLS